MADNNRGRDIGKLRVYAPQERDPATVAELEAAAEHKRMIARRKVMAKLEPTIREQQSLLGIGSSLSDKHRDKLRKLVLEALSLGLDDQLPRFLLSRVGLTPEPNPTVQVEDDGKAPF